MVVQENQKAKAIFRPKISNDVGKQRQTWFVILWLYFWNPDSANKIERWLIIFPFCLLSSFQHNREYILHSPFQKKERTSGYKENEVILWDKIKTTTLCQNKNCNWNKLQGIYKTECCKNSYHTFGVILNQKTICTEGKMSGLSWEVEILVL